MAKTTKATKSEIEAILRKSYSIDLVYGETPEDGVVAKVAEWPGCMTAGDTRAEALAHIGDAMWDWVKSRIDDGLNIPEPMAAFSGKLLLRLPTSLHRDADRRAKAEGVSLNQWIGSAVARELGPAPLPESLRIEGGDRTIEPVPGVFYDFRAIDQEGKPVANVQWSLSRKDLGTIDENGRYVPGKIPMGADVIARVGKLEARANIHVMPIRGLMTAASASARGRR